VDGTPENIGYGPMLLKLFPQAKFIFLFRHPADVVASMRRFDRAGGNAMTTAEALDFWLRMTQQGILMQRAFGAHVVKTVHYVDMVQNPVAVLDEIFRFVGEPRFRNAARVFQTKINSSEVSEEDHEATLRELEAMEKYTEALQIYDACVKLAGTCLTTTDSESLTALDEQINDIQTNLLAIFTGTTGTHPNNEDI
jgi:hypothetical protein